MRGVRIDLNGEKRAWCAWRLGRTWIRGGGEKRGCRAGLGWSLGVHDNVTKSEMRRGKKGRGDRRGGKVR